MGRKTKAPRTKNSLQPSSSSRCAELLGTNQPSFIGFKTMGSNDLSSGGFKLSDEMADNKIDLDFQLIFKKMSKKDPITKSKALQEFLEILSYTDVETMLTILPIWTKLYGTLGIDIEHRVRELVQQSHNVLVSHIGKNIAPFVRQLAPVWIVSRYDTYAPAANVAENSFNTVFPGLKNEKVFTFCHKEILYYLNETLMSASPVTGGSSTDEHNIKNDLIVKCSLQGYGLYLRTIPREEFEKEIQETVNIVNNAKFWSLQKHKAPNVRSAWYECLTVFLEHYPHLLNDQKKAVVVSVFSNLHETSSIVLRHLWPAAILITRNLDNWNLCVDIEKLVLAKLFKELKMGGSGNACIIFPYVLPLIDKLDNILPKENCLSFYNRLLDNLKIGQTASLNFSNAEIAAIVGCYHDCLNFVLSKIKMKNIFEAEKDYNEHCLKLIDDHLLNILNWAIANFKITFKNIFVRFGKLLLQWSEQSNDTQIHKVILKYFWNELYRVLEKNLANINDNDRILPAQNCLLNSLHLKSISKLTKQSVKFENEGRIDSTTVDCPAYEKEVAHLIFKMSKLYLSEAADKCNIEYVAHLKDLFSMFQNEALFRRLSETDSVADFANKLILWLQKPSLCDEHVVDIIFITFPYMPEDEQIMLLKRMLKFSNEIVNNWILTKILNGPFYADSSIMNLISEEQFTNLLIKCTKTALIEKSVEKLEFIGKYFQYNKASKAWMKTSSCQQILNQIVAPFVDDKLDKVLETCVHFVINIMPSICDQDPENHLQLLLFNKLFELSFSEKAHNVLAKDIEENLAECWRNVLMENYIQLNDEILSNCTNIIIRKLMSTGGISIENLARLSQRTTEFIDCALEQRPNQEEEVFDAIFKNKSLTEFSLPSTEHYFLYLELINGTMVDTSVECPELIDGQNMYESLEIALKSTLFKLSIILASVTKTPHISYVTTNSSMWIDWIANCLYISTLGNRIYQAMTKPPHTIADYITELETKIKMLLNQLPADTLGAPLIKKLIANAQNKGLFWSFTSLYLTNFKPYSDEQNGLILLFEDLIAIEHERDMPNDTIIQAITSKIGKRQLPIMSGIFKSDGELITKMITSQCLIVNYFQSDYNDIEDRQIIDRSIDILKMICATVREDKSYLLYNVNIENISSEKILFVAEVANYMSIIVLYFPSRLDTDIWDLVKIALSSWVLTISKSIAFFKSTKVSVFIAAVLRLFHSFSTFINHQSTKSSTKILSDLLEEWDFVFAKNVNLILVKRFMDIVKTGDCPAHVMNFIETISKTIRAVDLKYVFVENVKSAETNVDEIFNFSLNYIIEPNHYIRLVCMDFMKKLSADLIANDGKLLQNRSDSEQQKNESMSDNVQHTLYKFNDILSQFNGYIGSTKNRCKLNDPNIVSDLLPTITVPYLQLWNCIIEFCAKSPPEVRSLYASFITENEYDDILFTTLFNLMPSDVFKNPESKYIRQTYFVELTMEQLENPNLSIGHYACFTYIQALKYLPVLARKWWINLVPKQKPIVDKITTNCVSNHLCDYELQSLIENRDKHDNMQISVHKSSREVLASYSIDDTRLELKISLPINHPLGAVKVDIGKQIGGRLQSRLLVMQLAMFLTHQNGSIQNALSLWKKNLDRKFEGVEDCYVCYSVIHQNTCQLPKLSCKTCKKKFHGSCLYKWFSTSNKSTCPICRNIF